MPTRQEMAARKCQYGNDLEKSSENSGIFFNKGVVRVLKTIWIVSLGIAMILWTHVATAQEKKLSIHVQQITSGPKHHFFGYIGHGWINCSLE